MRSTSVHQLRTVLHVDDLDAAQRYFRDALGLIETDAIEGPEGARVVILAAGHATLELINDAQNRYIADVENAAASTPRVRVAFEVPDAAAATQALVRAGMPLITAPVRTPWDSLNARLGGMGDVPVTVFQELAPAAAGLVAATMPALGGEAGLLERLVDLATRNAVGGALPYSAAVVRDEQVIGVGVNTAVADLDVTAHAEVAAVRDACTRVGSLDLAGATVYSSFEPCALCRIAAVTAGVSQIVFAAGGELVPPMDDAALLGRRLVDAVAEQLPGFVRRGTTSLDADALIAPFRART